MTAAVSERRGANEPREAASDRPRCGPPTPLERRRVGHHVRRDRFDHVPGRVQREVKHHAGRPRGVGPLAHGPVRRSRRRHRNVAGGCTSGGPLGYRFRCSAPHGARGSPARLAPAGPASHATNPMRSGPNRGCERGRARRRPRECDRVADRRWSQLLARSQQPLHAHDQHQVLSLSRETIWL